MHHPPQAWIPGCRLVHMGSRTARYSAANGRRVRLPAVMGDKIYPWGGFADVVGHHSELVGLLTMEMVIGSKSFVSPHGPFNCFRYCAFWYFVSLLCLTTTYR